MNDMTSIYADYQATTPLDPRVRDCMAPFWSEAFGNPHSSEHAVGWKANKAVRDATSSVAKLIGADPDEVIFTSGATEANNLALFGIAGLASREKSRILVSAIEHKCVLAASREISERTGLILEFIPVNREGVLDLSTLEATLADDVLIVSIMAVNNEVGTIQNLQAISALLSSRCISFHCDAAQAPSAMDVKDLAHYADMISLSAHKMYGPQGIGALYIRRELQNYIQPLLYGGGQQHGLRSGTLPLPLCVGMGKAADLLHSDDSIEERARISHMRDYFLKILFQGGANVTLNGPPSERRHPGNANLCFHGYDAQDILNSLQPQLAASTGAACTTGIPEPSHVLQAMNLPLDHCLSSLRISFGRFTSENDIVRTAQLLLDSLR